MPPKENTVEPSCLRWLPPVSLLATYAMMAAGFSLGADSANGAGLMAALGIICLWGSLLLSLVTPVLAWVAVRRQQARLLNLAVLVLALFNLMSMFLA